MARPAAAHPAAEHPAAERTARWRRRPEAGPATLVARGWDDARRMLGQYVEAGLSKFVVRPASPGPFGPFLDGFVRELLPIQN